MRKEPPIYNQNIKIIFENDDFLIVNKPASMTLFPGGIYRKNTMFTILRDSYKYKDLYTIHKYLYLISHCINQLNINIKIRKAYIRCSSNS